MISDPHPKNNTKSLLDVIIKCVQYLCNVFNVPGVPKKCSLVSFMPFLLMNIFLGHPVVGWGNIVLFFVATFKLELQPTKHHRESTSQYMVAAIFLQQILFNEKDINFCTLMFSWPKLLVNACEVSANLIHILWKMIKCNCDLSALVKKLKMNLGIWVHLNSFVTSAFTDL